MKRLLLLLIGCLISIGASAQYAVDYISKVMPDCDIYTAVLDPELDSHKYIVPGLGDCGDLAFGDKL